MRRLVLAVLALVLLRADMYPDASNAKLPQARTNLGVGRPVSIMDHGAKADTVTQQDGVIAAGSATFTSNFANFTSADIGKKIQIDGAAGIWQPPHMTTITAVTDAHTVTLAAPATVATPRRWLSGAFVWNQRTTGNYVPGDLMTVQGGTFVTAAVLRVISTQVSASSIVAAGTGGLNGACRIQGTTGSGTKFQQNVTIAGGAISALATPLYVPGHYFTNPTNPAAEPVQNAPGYNCAPTGATINISMGVEQVVPQVKGNYDPVAIPADTFTTSAGSISGATGATFNSGGLPWGTFAPTGAFYYGHDDSLPLKNAIDAAAAIRATGKPAYVFLPAGNYLIDQTPTPLMWSGLGFIGEGTGKTNITIGANYVGDLFSWDEAWAGAGIWWASGLGAPMPVVDNYAGPKIVGMTISGTRTAAHRQNAIMFYDRVDAVFIDDVHIQSITGQCMASGIRKIPDYPASMRESVIGRMGCMLAGQPGLPAMEFSTEGAGDATDEININDINIYAHYGDALVFRNNSTNGNPLRNIRINKLRIEGQQWADAGVDNLVIGDPAMPGPITGININQLELLTYYPNRAGLRITGPGDIYYIQVESGIMGGGLPMGYGMIINGGRQISIRLRDVYSWNTNVTIGPSNGGVFLDLDGGEEWLTYNVSNPWMLSTPGARKVGMPWGQADRNLTPYLTPTYPDSTTRGGNARAAGTVDWQMVRDRADLVARGQSSVIGGGDSNSTSDGALMSVVGGGTWNSIAGQLGTISGGSHNAATGYTTTIPGGAFGLDRGAYGGMFLGGPGCQPFQIPGSCQRSWHILSAFINTATATRMTSDNGVPVAGGANCVPIQGGTSYQTVIRATARNWGANENASWSAIEGMLAHKGGWPVQYLGGAGGAPTHVTAGAFGTLTVAADDTNKCLSLTYTPPAGNTDYIHIVATVDVTEVQ